MQTFLPYPSFVASARCLDNKRLGKQRVEAYQILRALLGKTKGWQHHPAVNMWRGYEQALVHYIIAICLEWQKRGFQDTVQRKSEEMLPVGESHMPPWMGYDAFHAAHRSNLLRKDPVWYGQFGWKEGADLPYVWPPLSLHPLS